MKKRRKILYVITKSVWGGAQRYVYDLATNMPKDEFEVKVAAGGSGLLFEKLKSAGIETIRIASFERDINIFKEIFALWELTRIFLRERPDIIHLNSSKAGGIGSIAAFLHKLLTFNFEILTVFTVHGWGFLEPRPRWQNFAIRAASRVSAWLQDKIILINHADLKAADFAPTKKLVFTPLGIEKPSIISRSEARKILSERSERNIKNDDIIIGTIAELTKNKGLDYLVDAAAILRDIMPEKKLLFLIIGDGEKRIELEEKIKKMGLRDLVQLLGFIPDASRLLSGFDVFVLPSLKEGLPYTIMEAMAAGIPAVASRVGGVLDLIDDQENGILVAPGDAKALANAAKTAILKDNLRKKMGTAGAKKIAERFPLESMIENTANLYRQC